MENKIVKYPSFTEYDFIRLYCALNLKYRQSPLLIHHELEKKLYKFYNLPELGILFEDICPKKDYANEANSYLLLSTAFQTAQTFGLLTSIQGVGETRSIISCDDEQADQIISDYDSEIVSSMCVLFNLLFKNSDNNQFNFNEENIEYIRGKIKENNIDDKDGEIWAMMQNHSGQIDVKATEKSRKILAKSLLK